jgi:hypothetical protein
MTLSWPWIVGIIVVSIIVCWLIGKAYLMFFHPEAYRNPDLSFVMRWAGRAVEVGVGALCITALSLFVTLIVCGGCAVAIGVETAARWLGLMA